MTGVWALAAMWFGLALIASLVSVWFRGSTALTEIIIGIVAQLIIGAIIGSGLLDTNDIWVKFLSGKGVLGTNDIWVKFLSGAGAILLTFLAGAELGLTFGTVAALFGRSHGIVDGSQYSTLVAAIIGTAIIPTVVANTFFLPRHLLPRLGPETSCYGSVEAARQIPVFGKILHGNDGSEQAFRALTQALAIAKQNNSDLHMVSVEKTGYVAELVEEAREETGASQRFGGVVQRARAMAEESNVKLHTHVVAGRPVRSIVALAAELHAELLVIGASNHSSFYVRLVGSRADRIRRLAPCPVLVVK